MTIRYLTLAALTLVSTFLLNGCDGYAKAGAERKRTVIGGSVTTEEVIYGEIGGSWILKNQAYVNSIPVLDPSAWELEIDPSFGLTTTIKNKQVAISAINNNDFIAKKSFSLKIENNKARFTNPDKVSNWLELHQGSSDSYRAEVIAITRNDSESTGQVTAKWKSGSVLKASVSYSVAGVGSCNPSREPSEIIEIC